MYAKMLKITNDDNCNNCDDHGAHHHRIIIVLYANVMKITNDDGNGNNCDERAENYQ